MLKITSTFHAHPSMIYLEKIYDAPRQIVSLDDKEHSPLMGHILTDDEIRRARTELTELGYIAQDRHSRLYLTLKGSECVRDHRKTTLAIKLSSIAIGVSILAFLKPPSFDLVTILYELLRGAK